MVGHVKGPETEYRKEVVRVVDKAILYLLDQIEILQSLNPIKYLTWI